MGFKQPIINFDQKTLVQSEIQNTLNQILELLQSKEKERKHQQDQVTINQILWSLIENNAVQTIKLPELDIEKK
jgi:hypothetical protein